MMYKIRADILIIAICVVGIFFVFMNRVVDIGDAVLIFLLAALFESMRRADRIDFKEN